MPQKPLFLAGARASLASSSQTAYPLTTQTIHWYSQSPCQPNCPSFLFSPCLSAPPTPVIHRAEIFINPPETPPPRRRQVCTHLPLSDRYVVHTAPENLLCIGTKKVPSLTPVPFSLLWALHPPVPLTNRLAPLFLRTACSLHLHTEKGIDRLDPPAPLVLSVRLC